MKLWAILNNKGRLVYHNGLGPAVYDSLKLANQLVIPSRGQVVVCFERVWPKRKAKGARGGQS